MVILKPFPREVIYARHSSWNLIFFNLCRKLWEKEEEEEEEQQQMDKGE